MKLILDTLFFPYTNYLQANTKDFFLQVRGITVSSVDANNSALWSKTDAPSILIGEVQLKFHHPQIRTTEMPIFPIAFTSNTSDDIKVNYFS